MSRLDALTRSVRVRVQVRPPGPEPELEHFGFEFGFRFGFGLKSDACFFLHFRRGVLRCVRSTRRGPPGQVCQDRSTGLGEGQGYAGVHRKLQTELKSDAWCFHFRRGVFRCVRSSGEVHQDRSARTGPEDLGRGKGMQAYCTQKTAHQVEIRHVFFFSFP